MKRPSHLAMLLVATAAYVLLLLAVFPHSYWENDNIGILEDIRQGQTVSFMSILLGRVLSFLYRDVSDAVPWYGLLLYGLTGTAFFLAVAAVDTLCRRRVLKYAFMAMLAVLGARFIVTVSYNAASILVGFTSLLALFVHLRRAERPRWSVVLALGVLFSFTYLVRTSGLKAVGVFGILFVGWELMTRFRRAFPRFLVFLLPLVVLAGTDTGLGRYDVSEEYVRFRQWNQVRGKLHGFPVLQANVGNERLLLANRWDPLHYTLLQSWTFFDEDKFNVETLGNIRKYSVPLPGEDGPRIGAVLGNAWDLLDEYWPQWLALVVLIGLAAYGGRRRPVVLQSLHALWFLGGAAAMATYLRFPGRIAYPLLFGAMLFAFCLLQEDETDDPGRETGPAPGRSFLVVALLLLGAGLADLTAVSALIDNTGKHQRQYYLNEARLRDLQPEMLVIASSRVSGMEYRNPLRVHRDRLPAVPAGWGIFSPRFYAFLREHGLERASEFLPYLVQKDDIYIVSNPYYVRLLSEYIWLTHRTRAKPKLVFSLEDRVDVYQLRLGKPGRLNKRGGDTPVVLE